MTMSQFSHHLISFLLPIGNEVWRDPQAALPLVDVGDDTCASQASVSIADHMTAQSVMMIPRRIILSEKLTSSI